MPDEQPVGWKTMSDGSRQPLFQHEADALMARADAAKAKREADMPTEQSAINTMFDAWLRLKELGWKEAMYCPKDGSTFDAVEPGSTGIFKCHYDGEWPKGTWWIEDFGDLWPASPVLYRPSADETETPVQET